jgi:RNA polymerase sigma-70 factor (ECF subfamily)
MLTFLNGASTRMRVFHLGNVSDEDLLRQLRNGATDALAILFDRHYRQVFSVAHGILRNRAAAEDVMQAVFLEVYRDAGRFDPTRGSVKNWLLRCASHRSLNPSSAASSADVPLKRAAACGP